MRPIVNVAYEENLRRLCEAYAGLRKDRAAALPLRDIIVDLKTRLPPQHKLTKETRLAMILTCDEAIADGLPKGHAARSFYLPHEDQVALARRNTKDFIFLAERGLQPPNDSLSGQNRRTAIRRHFESYGNRPRPDYKRALHFWTGRKPFLANLIFEARKPGAIAKLETAKLVAVLLRDQVRRQPSDSDKALILMARRSDDFSLIAALLAGARLTLENPQIHNDKRLELILSANSNHGTLKLERDYGPLHRHLQAHDQHTFKIRHEVQQCS